MLRSSKRFAEMAQEIETEHFGDWGTPHCEEHMDLVIAAVLNSSTFLEAMINELFTDAADGHGHEKDGYIAPLSAGAVRLMAEWWRETDEGFDRTLTKYQLLLAFAGHEKLDRGAEPFQSAALLLRLRNAIVHYRPETIYSDEPHRLEVHLSGRFAANGLIAGGSNWWPNRALGAGAARWSYTVAQEFTDAVVSRLGIAPNYQRLGI
jgi:hypothetical protein